ncbi:two-partner secretion domain-containing protein [Nostoc sp. 'Lobaria pulmonaria (5183) cyanobiont']|uniref:two-partner secretion domain-containing protein n=1 Tax=Nostoc sp. 'Lobaria pulmonaria (5183) cyanobiont' TaxID=1618022 RepID=UPI000CF355A5|nr:filamentous hemagglutinin N-terminal domain-containing protein [Nostoc sp. 'Lobaria pulmonaria (5183) cyanobiont']AVH71848.1 filamentous hemagglutinin outer membrane protein [Nostoc sp. 'Lobaria pulmonaria (5183) cyanobiont']
MSIRWVWFKSLGSVIGCAVALFTNSAVAQITQDGTLPNNSQVTQQDNITIIEGGTLSQSGRNLFHSFKEFSVIKNSIAEFKNADSVQNIISRVTGKSVSNIDGILKANGTANLFLINPNGIIFGPSASLQIGGSFVASTASSLNFTDGTKFSATDPQTPPLLTVNVPNGLQFGTTAAFIHNQSQAPSSDGVTTNIPVGLQVQQNKTLALVGGDITLEGGNLTAASGRIELGSVANNSLVDLKPTDQGWILGYQGVQNFQDIRLVQRTVDSSKIASQVNTSNRDGSGGNIQIQGNLVELIGPVVLKTQTTGVENGGDLTITSKKIIIRDGAQVSTTTLSKGDGGNLTVNASESVEVIGGFSSPDSDDRQPSGLLSSTAVAGKAGSINIKTGRLLIEDGGQVATDSTALGIIAGTGTGGNLTVSAFSVELIGNSTSGSTGLFASTNTSGDAGDITIDTKELMIRNGAKVTVSSQLVDFFTYAKDLPNSGKAGDLNITARSILLDNAGKLISDSKSGRGGNITLQVRDLLLMRRESKITTNAKGNGDGGNITINAPNGFLVASPLGNNDITANGFSGSGGKITITAKNLFGFVPRTGTDVQRLDPVEKDPNNLLTNDITAFSQQNPSLNGTVQINSPDADPSKGLVELPVNLVDASRQIVASCSTGGKIGRSSFIQTGRGGLVADPTQPLIADDAVLADWITLSPQSQNRAGGIQKRAVVQGQRNTEEKSQKVNSVNEPIQIVEAQGWVMDANGNVVLVAQVPAATLYNSSLTSKSCPAN